MKLFALVSMIACVVWMDQTLTKPLLAQPSTDSAPKPTVALSFGELRGSLTYDGEAVFKNVPFAQPPVGNLRWRDPLPPNAWKGIRDANVFGPACYQAGHLNEVSSEDCLQLNIWTPTWPMKSRVPVMVWFHGGGNIAGSAIEPLFNGETLARRGIVLVSANYRLGIFGFFVHPELTKESPHHSSGNYGLLDQIMALRWVHDNIAQFGGDPENVTIIGESAGAIDVNSLLATPQSEGLFIRAIAESGAVGDAPSLAEGEKRGEELAAKLNITGGGALAKLRAVPSADLAKAASTGGPSGGGNMLGIIVDGWVLPESPASAFAAGHEHKVALLFGNNSQELQKPFGPVSGSPKDAITEVFGPLSDQALKLYGLSGGADPQPDPQFGTVQAQWSTDSTFRCATIQELIWHTAAGNPAYEYQFSRTVHGKESEGAPHAAEIPFVFGTLPVWQEMRHYDLSDRLYAPVVQEYWVNFAKTGNPNGVGLPQWPQFDPAGRAYLDFTDSGPTAKAGLRRSICDLYIENRQRVRQ